MAQPYVGQIMMFAGNFAPAGWAMCQGQLMPISENETLFQLIGTTYGGDGESTFGLPAMGGRVPIHMGQGSGLSNYIIGQSAGSESVTLNSQQIPQHNHQALVATGGSGGSSNKIATNSILADQSGQVPGNGALFVYGPSGGTQQQMANTSIGLTGGNQPHENIQPVLAVTYIISLFGVFPTQ